MTTRDFSPVLPLRALFAALFALAAVSHVARAAHGDGDLARHAIFVALNLGCGALLVARSRYALAAIATLALQQLPSHGADLVRSLREPRFDWASLGVVVFFPIVVTTLWLERRSGTRARPTGAPPRR